MVFTLKMNTQSIPKSCTLMKKKKKMWWRRMRCNAFQNPKNEFEIRKLSVILCLQNKLICQCFFFIFFTIIQDNHDIIVFVFQHQFFISSMEYYFWNEIKPDAHFIRHCLKRTFSNSTRTLFLHDNSFDNIHVHLLLKMA